MRRLSQARAGVAAAESRSPRFGGAEGLGVGGASAARRSRLASHPVRFANHAPRRVAGGGMAAVHTIARGEALR